MKTIAVCGATGDLCGAWTDQQLLEADLDASEEKYERLLYAGIKKVYPDARIRLFCDNSGLGTAVESGLKEASTRRWTHA